MLAFLIGTSILNIFLGYALAVYLMRESLTLENHRSQGSSPKSGDAPVGEQRERSELYPASATHSTGPRAGRRIGDKVR